MVNRLHLYSSGGKGNLADILDDLDSQYVLDLIREAATQPTDRLRFEALKMLFIEYMSYVQKRLAADIGAKAGKGRVGRSRRRAGATEQIVAEFEKRMRYGSYSRTSAAREVADVRREKNQRPFSFERVRQTLIDVGAWNRHCDRKKR